LISSSQTVPFRSQQRHDQFIAMDTAEKGASSGNAFGLEADSFVATAGAMIVRKKAEPNSMGVCFTEDRGDKRRHHCSAVAQARLANDYALDVGGAFARRPIANDDKAAWLRSHVRDKIDMAAVAQRGPMLALAPAADEMLVAGEALRRHHEADVVLGAANKPQQI
jgi:hypothetical protein